MSTPTKILVVEDEAVVAKDLQMRLRKLGYDVPLTVQSGEEALEAARNLRPELILMDVRLKGKVDGVEASAQIMEQFRTPVIFLTAYADDGTLSRAKLTEPYGFILKPFNERELHTAIQVALHKHRGEIALRKSQRWLAGTLRSIGDGIIAVDSDMKILFMNDLASTLTGWSEKDAAGRELRDVYRLVHSTTGEAMDDMMAAVCAQRPGDHHGTLPEISKREAVLVSRDGTRIAIEDTGAPILDDASVAGGVLVFRDVSRRKQAEEDQRQSEERLRSLANSMAHLAWMAGPDGDIFWYNERWFEYTGTKLEQVRGSGWKAVHDPAMLPEVTRRWEESLAMGTSFEMEFPLRHNSGKFRWFLTRATPVLDFQGKVTRWFGTHTDVHDAREIRERLQRANANLAQFAYSASHDLREPLRNLTVYSQLLNRRYSQTLDLEGAQFLGYITEGATRMESLVNDLLEFAESGNPSDVPLESVDSAEVLQEVLAELKTVITESGAEIVAGKLPVLISRQVHLRQLLQNLVSNAVKFRSSHKPTVHVSAERKNSEWIFSIADNGIGISKEYQEGIFGLFKRLHKANEYAGTGLGLALCHNIVSLYGGRIWVMSEVGKGATFSFALPA